jgi:uncharacterized sodium:solute symporter family permease YidK
MTVQSGLGFDALVLLTCYLLSNILIGYVAYRSGETWTARDYFLGGKSTGAVVLFFAMLATKFSGNTFFGLPGQVYRVGLMAATLIPFTVAISLGFLSYAPRLYVLSKKYDYLTPADFYAEPDDSSNGDGTRICSFYRRTLQFCLRSYLYFCCYAHLRLAERLAGSGMG